MRNIQAITTVLGLAAILILATACGPEKAIRGQVEIRQNVSDSALLIQAEDFETHGDWMQSTDGGAMGGYILYLQGVPESKPDQAEIRPTQDARTVVTIASAGLYHVWVRARDYDTIPGSRRYAVTVDDQQLANEAGNHGQNGWAWQEAGTIQLEKGEHSLGLHDTTNFFGRCDAVLLTTSEVDLVPTGKVADNMESLAPVALSDSDARKLAVLDNGLTRLVFEKRTTEQDGPFISRSTELQVDGSWKELPGRGEKETLFVLYAPAGDFNLGKTPTWSTTADPISLGDSGETLVVAPTTDNPFNAAPALRLVPRSARQAGPRAVVVDYEVIGEQGIFAVNTIVGTWSLLPGEREARFELALTPLRTGYYTAGMCAFDAWEKDQVKFVQLPPLYQFQRLPEKPIMVTSSLTPHPLVLVQVKPEGFEGRDVSFAAIAEMDRLPYRWPNAYNMVYGFSLLNARGQAQPCIFNPVMGAEGSKWQAGEKKTVAWRLLAYPGDWKQTLEYYSEEIAEVTDYRKPLHGSLTDAVFNMRDLMMDEKYGGWHPHLKGFYDIETPAMGKQGAPLAVIEGALLARDETFWAERALPTIEFTLRSKGPAVIRAGEIEKERAARPRVLTGQLSVPTEFYDTSYWEGVESILGGVNPWLREFALPGGEVYQSMGYNTAPSWSPLLARYRMEPSPELLVQIQKEADSFLKEQIYGRQAAVVDFNAFYNISFIPYWWELIDLYDQWARRCGVVPWEKLGELRRQGAKSAE
ncbi:hypothetical protein HQ520_02305 [bacterium]|nr:hypothetical protein [bacterium]